MHNKSNNSKNETESEGGSANNFRLKSPNKTGGSGSRRNSDRIEQISSR
jgi:hypothetical protein